jgi:hypothetical protein
LEAEGVLGGRRRVSVREAWEHWMSLNKDWAESDLCNSRRVGKLTCQPHGLILILWNQTWRVVTLYGNGWLVKGWSPEGGRPYCVNVGV